MNRVVVTGVGAVTPIGNSAPEFWANALAGKIDLGILAGGNIIPPQPGKIHRDKAAHRPLSQGLHQQIPTVFNTGLQIFYYYISLAKTAICRLHFTSKL